MPDAPPELLGEKEYEVIGPRAVFGHPPGQTVTLNLTQEQETYYIDAGHLKVTAKKGGKASG